MKEHQIDIPFEIDRPGGKITKRLPEYLEGLAAAIRVPSGELAQLSNLDLIALWSQQSGAAHEDWCLDERLATIFSQGLFFNGQPIHGVALCGVCRTVLHVGREFLAAINPSDA